jgi:uncharacterized protein YaiL (DUF2058 family)
MANSLQDQLLNTGLASEEQLQQALDAKKRPRNKAKNKPRRSPLKTVSKQPKAAKPIEPPKKPKNPPSDLAQFYKKRTKFEKNTREEAARKQREAKLLRKENMRKIRKVVLENIQNTENAEIRYNFIVGSNIKYIHVTEAQQTALSAGELAITFLGRRRCLIPISIIDAIRAIEPSTLIIAPSKD